MSKKKTPQQDPQPVYMADLNAWAMVDTFVLEAARQGVTVRFEKGVDTQTSQNNAWLVMSMANGPYRLRRFVEGTEAAMGLVTLAEEVLNAYIESCRLVRETYPKGVSILTTPRHLKIGNWTVDQTGPAFDWATFFPDAVCVWKGPVFNKDITPKKGEQAVFLHIRDVCETERKLSSLLDPKTLGGLISNSDHWHYFDAIPECHMYDSCVFYDRAAQGITVEPHGIVDGVLKCYVKASLGEYLYGYLIPNSHAQLTTRIHFVSNPGYEMNPGRLDVSRHAAVDLSDSNLNFMPGTIETLQRMGHSCWDILGSAFERKYVPFAVEAFDVDIGELLDV